MNQTTNTTSSGLIDVLSGNKSAKLEISIDTTSLIILGMVILVAVAIGVIIGKKVN
jgi:hypothetical protein